MANETDSGDEANQTDSGDGATQVSARRGDASLQLAGYDSAGALAGGLTENWTEAVAALSHGRLEEHARDVMHDSALAGDIAEIQGDKSVSEDTRLFRVIQRMHPAEDPVFMGYELNEQGLAELAAEVDGPFPTWSATAALRIMYTDRILTLAAESSKTPRFRELDVRWHEEFDAWAALAAKSQDAGGPDVFSKAAWHTRAKLLRGLIDTKGDEELRTRAREALQKPTVASWAKDVGSLEGAGVGTLMGVADLGDAADLYDEQQRTEKKETSSKRRKGALSGFVSIGLIVVIVVGVAAFTTSSGSNDITFTTKPTPSASKSIDPSNAPVIGTATITKATNLLADPDAGSQVVTKLKKGARVFQIGHDQNGFYQVKTSDEPVQFGWVDKSVAVIICPVQCGG
ncbi:MAG TPA: SH3 domain-containing protein [Actinomycetota bacterium]|nr:SH3 domain-containing protein [Actinomycetota bacterium]